MSGDLDYAKIRLFGFSISYAELFLLSGFVFLHIINIRPLMFLYYDTEILENLYRFENLTHGKVPFVDYIVSYGPLLWDVHAWFYKFLPPGVFSTNIVLLVISPIISLCMGYACARLIFKNKFSVVCFLILTMLLFRYTESWFYSCRVWAGLLTLAFFASGLITGKKYHLFSSGVILIATFFVSYEISLYVFASVFMVIPFILILDRKYYKPILYFLSGLILGAIFFTALYHQFIKGYLTHALVLSGNYNWVMGLPFPGFFDERQKIFFGYFRPFFINLLALITLCVIYFKWKKDAIKIVSLILPFVLFGFFIHRSLISRSDDAHLYYIVAPAVLVLVLLIELYLNKRQAAKDFINRRYFLSIFIITIASIFFLRNVFWDQLLIYKTRFRVQPRSDESFFAPFGVFLRNDKVEEFTRVCEYIKEHTLADDYIYVFPRGPHYFLTGRRNPAMHYELTSLYTRQMRRALIEEIEKKHTKYIINPIVWFPDSNNLLFAREVSDYAQTHFFLEEEMYNTKIFKRRPYPIQKNEPRLINKWGSADINKIRMDGLSGNFARGNLRVENNNPSLECFCPPAQADLVEITISLSEYPILLRSLAKPSLALIAYDNDGMVSYEAIGVPSDGQKYSLRYNLKKTREITRLKFLLEAPGLFNPQPTYINIDDVSLLLQR